MTWRFPPHEHEVFARNPLVAVVAQLRFHPVLKLADHIADFQEAIRDRFPAFEKKEVRQATIVMAAPGQPMSSEVDVRQSELFCFSDPERQVTVTLGVDQATIEARSHVSVRDVINDVNVVVPAVESVYKPIRPTRLGLRYVNLIDRQTISKSLGKDVDWPDIINQSFLSPASDLADLDDTAFYVETTSSCGPGAMTLRYGLLPGTEGQKQFRVDIDRYTTERLSLSSAAELLQDFSLDVFRAFRATAGEDLLSWMRATEEDDGAL
jgi:uncharacterized protein (TIGR04255 family)